MLEDCALVFAALEDERLALVAEPESDSRPLALVVPDADSESAVCMLAGSTDAMLVDDELASWESIVDVEVHPVKTPTLNAAQNMSANVKRFIVGLLFRWFKVVSNCEGIVSEQAELSLKQVKLLDNL